LSSPESTKAAQWVGTWGGVYGGKITGKDVLNFEWKRVGVMDGDSGDDGTDELR